MTSIRSYEVESVFGKLIDSQREFLYAPESMSAIAGGVGCGKSHIGILKGLLLSAAIPGNRGLCTCYHGTDLEDRLVPLFEELCPPSWIKLARKKPSRVYVLRNNSAILFKHLHDARSATKSGRLGLNLGWIFVDQLEETEEQHFNMLLGRLRWPRAPKKFIFASLNPAGRDWIWEKFFQGVRPFPKDEFGHAQPLNGKLHQILRPRPDTLGIAVDSEENRISNGGFVEDAFFDRMLENFGEAYVNRYVHCSFDDFKGKLTPDYEAGLIDPSTASVHNIRPFKPPAHWECIGGIDVGGDSPWAVVPIYIDEEGNLIVCKGFDRITGRVAEVANWIKSNMPYNQSRTTFLIDPENKVALVELSDHGVYCQVAQKDVFPGLLRLDGYLHVNPNRSLPKWYTDAASVGFQGEDRLIRFRRSGSPRMFVMEDALQWRKEFNTAKWDPKKTNQMYKSATARYDQVDATRYVCMHHPEPSKGLPDDKYDKLERADPMAAREARAWDKKLAQLEGKIAGRGMGRNQANEDEYDEDPLEKAMTVSGEEF